ncbi:muramidase family protein [Lacisediminihabitans changchengi]|uniref:LysM peptidoglycan-binding domain-containing protein n=1 Tax=Lacisediminihabitans changchengi TaxID=2787634 RepID=A0A934STC3_9MICO|nr:LysM peptidoglycan-binding domain-containing protein [Lacisediminihabitans changchengi]MBK4347744.1 LysM peptidoglycan-binding domain-containing protein [Lacisediminihabitans changchengi]
MNNSEQRARKESQTARERVGRSLFATIPIVVAGSMAVGLGLTGPIHPVSPKRTEKPKTTPGELAKTVRHAFAGASKTALTPSTEQTSVAAPSTAAAPTTYTVAAGDSVSSIAGRFGLATASVLALNGLGWKSVIFPGQVLRLSASGAVPVVARPTPPAPSAGAIGGRYTIQKGDTIGHIAARYGTSTQAILTANGLSLSSIIYPGQSIAIPGSTAAAVSSTPILNSTPAVSITPAPAPGPALPTSTAPVVALSAEMAANARTIISVGRSLGVPDYGIVIGLAAALQESGLRNLHYGDRDSLGLFQQRPSTGWGTPAQVTDPTYSARLFFGGKTNPNRGKTNGLLDIANWQTKTVTQAAQAVQRSAYPDAYAKWESTARAALSQLR